MHLLLSAVVLAAAVWVAVDSANLGAHRGRLGGGLLDMGPVAWFFAVLLLWLIGLPCYLYARTRLVAVRDTERRRAALPVPHGPGGLPPGAVAPAAGYPGPTYAGFPQAGPAYPTGPSHPPPYPVVPYPVPAYPTAAAPVPHQPLPGAALPPAPGALLDPHTGALVALPVRPTVQVSSLAPDEQTMAELSRLSRALQAGELTEQAYEDARSQVLAAVRDGTSVRHPLIAAVAQLSAAVAVAGRRSSGRRASTGDGASVRRRRRCRTTGPDRCPAAAARPGAAAMVRARSGSRRPGR